MKESDAPGPDGKPRTIVEVDRVVAAGPAFNAGLRPGMWIIAVGEARVGNVLQFLAAIQGHDLERRLPLFVITPDGRGAGLTIMGPKAFQEQQQQAGQPPEAAPPAP